MEIIKGFLEIIAALISIINGLHEIQEWKKNRPATLKRRKRRRR